MNVSAAAKVVTVTGRPTVSAQIGVLLQRIRWES